MFQNTKKHAQSLILFRKSSEGAAEFASPSMQLSVVCTLVTGISEVGSMPREGLPTDISVDRGCLLFTKNSRKFRLGCRWNTIFWPVPLENFRNERNFWLFTIYKQKPVGTRFVQMVSQNSRMGNLVGIGVYHLQNPFKVTERVWKGGKIMGVCKWKTRFRLEIPFGKFGLPFKKFRFLRKFSVWEDQNRLTIYIPTEISGFLW